MDDDHEMLQKNAKNAMKTEFYQDWYQMLFLVNISIAGFCLH